MITSGLVLVRTIPFICLLGSKERVDNIFLTYQSWGSKCRPLKAKKMVVATFATEKGGGQ